MYRYLINMSYIGTPFRGVQRQVGASEGRLMDPSTIQGQIEIGLQFLRPLNQPAAVLSSRTDSGVHALHTTMHVDLERPNGAPYDPTAITGVLNNYFNKHMVPIRILKTFLVPNSFHCRKNSVSRTYLYRLAVVQSKEDDGSMLHQHLPIEEHNRCLFIGARTFDLDKMREAGNLFIGRHDFRTFMHKSSKEPNRITRKEILNVEIEDSQMLRSNQFIWPYCVTSKPENYKFFNIVVKGKGFLYRQVRRTVASLIAVAKGTVTPKDIKFMLEIPSHRSWNPRIKTLPPFGLYLCEVAYSVKDQETFKDHLED